MTVREARPGELEALAELFRRTIYAANAGDYTREQLDAWASGSADLEAWGRSFAGHLCLVAAEGGAIAGFGDISRTGYLDRLFVRADAQGKGIGTALCDCLERAAPGKIFTHASITARPFFEKRGYRVIREQRVRRRGIALTNFVMEREG